MTARSRLQTKQATAPNNETMQLRPLILSPKHPPEDERTDQGGGYLQNRCNETEKGARVTAGSGALWSQAWTGGSEALRGLTLARMGMGSEGNQRTHTVRLSE